MDTELFKPEYTEGAIELTPKRPAGVAMPKISLQQVRNNYIETCVLRTPWDQPKVSRLPRCPDFSGQFTCK